MQDDHVLVKDTATWTIAKICELHVRSIPEQVVPKLMENLVLALGDSPRVSARACFALNMFGEAFEESKDSDSNAMSPYFSVVAHKLLQVIGRDDWHVDNMRVQATEALNVLIQNSAQDQLKFVIDTLNVILSMLEGSFNMQVISNDDKEKQQGLQSLLCGSVQVICQKVKKCIIPFGDQIVALLLRVFSTRHAVAQEEVGMRLRDPNRLLCCHLVGLAICQMMLADTLLLERIELTIPVHFACVTIVGFHGHRSTCHSA